MKAVFQIMICMLLGYLIGGINPSYIFGKMKGFDIRSKGSGNAGASNAVITLGKGAGVFCAFFDIFKGYIAVKIGMYMYPLIKVAGIVIGVFCIIGHILPVFMNFRGGKGLASLGGVILAYDVKLFAIFVAIELVLVLLVDYICIVPMSGSFLFMTALGFQGGIIYALLFLPVVLIIFNKHMENIRRIKYGVEARFSYLWNKEEEEIRLQNNWDLLTDEQRDLFEEKAYI